MRLGRDGIAGLIGLAVSLALLPQALNLPKLPIVPVGPGFYPTIVLVFLGAHQRGAAGCRTSSRSAAQQPPCRRMRRRRRSAPTGWWLPPS